MVPTPLNSPHSSRLFVLLYTLISHYVSRFFSNDSNSNLNIEPDATSLRFGLDGRISKRVNQEPHDVKFIIFACLIPVLVLLSGVFAGLTLGYMSLDETQLNVLSISGTPKQRIYANRIKPIRQNGHLLLVTLLLGNMIVNETLPVISDPVLGGGVQSVVVSTVLIVIFAEIIPQSLCTRYGLYLGAKMAKPTQMLIYALGIIAWPVAKLLEFTLGPHHGIIYRRAELKELIAMHSSLSSHGGDLKNDTVTIIGATLDLQEKVVLQAMTPIDEVFMLSIESKLDYQLLKKICMTGHSRVPVYEEVDLPVHDVAGNPAMGGKVGKVKKIVGILLVKQCVLLDPNDAVPLRKIPLNKVPFVPKNMPLLGILDKFQEGRSHMAIVSRISAEKAASVKMVVKRGLTQRLRARVGMGDSDSSDDDGDAREKKKKKMAKVEGPDTEDNDGEATLKDDGVMAKNTDGRLSNGRVSLNGPRRGHSNDSTNKQVMDLEMGVVENKEKGKRRSSFVQLPFTGLEQMMPADAVLGKAGAEEFLQGIDPAVMPLGIITLEDVLEELIGEEIYDEFDPEGGHAPYVPAEVRVQTDANHLNPGVLRKKESAPQLSNSVDASTESGPTVGSRSLTSTPVLKPVAIKGLSFLTNRSRSAPPTPRDQKPTVNTPGSPSPPCSNVPLLLQSNSFHGQIIPLSPALEDESETTQQIPSIILDHVANVPPTITASVEGSNAVDNNPSKMQSSPDSSTAVPASTISGSVAPSRSVPPATSLEAVLLDRKRRLAASGGQFSAVIPAHSLGQNFEVWVPTPRTASPSIKGARFKSSPLGGGETSGIVVAEKVKENIQSENASREEFRIPDGKAKAGPDKGG